MDSTVYNQEYKNTDFHQHPEAYVIGCGEQGVLMVEPYKQQKKFVGMDVARKFSRLSLISFGLTMSTSR